MRLSNNYGLNLVEGSDIVNPLVQDVRNYEKIDEIMKENSDCGIPVATELLTGTVHALTRTKPDAPMFRFVATSKYSNGDTFTVDGVQVTALLTTGEPLKDGAYVINANVIACLVGTVLTLFCGQNNEGVHAVDSDKLGGELPSHYASAASVVEAVNLAQGANQIALSQQDTISKMDKNVNDLLNRLGVGIGCVTFSTKGLEEYVDVPYPDGFGHANSNVISTTIVVNNSTSIIHGIDVQLHTNYLRIYTKESGASYKNCSIFLIKLV